MQVTIMYRNTYDGGDGWTYYPMTVVISDCCPKCGQQRGTPEPYQFCEDGEYFTVDRWTNACGHVDTYKDVYQEANEVNLQPTGNKTYERKKKRIEAFLADAHSCRSFAEWTDNGPQGDGYYCTECGQFITSNAFE